MRKLFAKILVIATILSLLPATPMASAVETTGEMSLAYAVNFKGTDGIFEPTGLSGAYSNFTYTSSSDGSSLTIMGKDYSGSDPNGIQKQAYWGGTVKGLTAGRKTNYELVYKVKNNSTKAYSQVGIGGLVPDTGVPTAVWNVASTYNASGSVVLSMLTGNRSGISGSSANRNTLRDKADRDEQGFIDMKIAFNGHNETMVLYTKVNGEWQELYERGIEMTAGSRMGVIFYTLRSGSINMTVKDMKFYSDCGKVASAGAETVENDNMGITGYTELPKEMTLAEVKPRYGIEKKLVADGLTAVPTFRNEMDAYVAEIPYVQNGTVTLAESFSSAGYSDLYVKFSAAISSADTAIHNVPSQIKLQVTTDGTTWKDAGVTFTAKATGEKTVAAADVPVGVDGSYNFSKTTQIPVYEFTSGKFNVSGVKNIRLIPSTGSVKGSFRLLSLYVWGDTGETIRVPLLDGNQNPTATQTSVAAGTSYALYSTDFATTDGWTTNAVNWRSKTDAITVGGEEHPYCYFLTSGSMPVTDGMNLRIYSPNMELDASMYDELKLNFRFFRSASEVDPAISSMRLGYSTDNGNTWETINKSLSPVKMSGTNAVDGEDYTTYQVKFDLKGYIPEDQIVTNIVLMPYGAKQWYALSYYNGNPDALIRNDADMVNSRGAFRLLDLSLNGISGSSRLPAKAVPVYSKDYDSHVIQMMIDTAAAAGKREVTIPSVNPRDGSDTWIITRTIKVPSNMTLYINNCKLRMGNYAMCRMIQNRHCTGQSAEFEDQNIHIIGVGNAVLQGGLHNGLRTELLEGTTLTTWDNMTIALQNVDNFSVQNLRVEESRFYSVALYYCSNGKVDGIDLYNSRKLYLDNIETWEQDGVDIRPGTHDVWVNDITGRSGDDSVALVAIRPGNFEVVDKDPDIRNIVVTNVATKMTRLRMNVRITACNGLRIYNALIDGVYDTQADFGGKLSRNTVQIGNSATGYIVSGGRTMAPGEIHDIYLRNITGSTDYPIAVRHENVDNSHWAYEYDSCKSADSGVAATSLISYGDQVTHTLQPISCSHVWNRELFGTQHLQGLPAAAADLNWLGCAYCNAVKRPAGVDNLEPDSSVEEEEETQIPSVEDNGLINFAFARMILGNALDMQFAFPKAGVGAGAYVQVVRSAADGSKVTQTIPYAEFKSATISGVAHFYVTYTSIAAKEMSDTITATVYNASGAAISNPWVDSVREYAMRSLTAEGATTKNKTMLVDMLNYGAAAQVNFNYNADDPANKQLTAAQRALTTVADDCVNEQVKGAKNKGSRLILESSIKVQQAFSGLNDKMYAVVSFTNHSGRQISERIEGSEFQIASTSIIELDQITMADARIPYTLTIYNADGTVYDTHVDSVASYIARASENALYNAIMNFADSAYYYFHGSMPPGVSSGTAQLKPLNVVKGTYPARNSAISADLGFAASNSMLCFRVEIPADASWSAGVSVEYRILDANGTAIMEYSGNNRSIGTAAGGSYQFALSGSYLKNGYAMEALQGMTGVAVEITVVDGTNIYYAKETGLTIGAFVTQEETGVEQLNILQNIYDKTTNGRGDDLSWSNNGSTLLFKVRVPAGANWTKGVAVNIVLEESDGTKIAEYSGSGVSCSGAANASAANRVDYQFARIGASQLASGYTLEDLRGKTGVTLKVTVAEGDTVYYGEASKLTIEGYNGFDIAKGVFESGTADMDFDSTDTMLQSCFYVPTGKSWASGTERYGILIGYDLKDSNGGQLCYRADLLRSELLTSGIRISISRAPNGEAFTSMVDLQNANVKLDMKVSEVKSMDANGNYILGKSYCASESSMKVGTMTNPPAPPVEMEVVQDTYDKCNVGKKSDLSWTNAGDALMFKVKVPGGADWTTGVDVSAILSDEDGTVIAKLNASDIVCSGATGGATYQFARIGSEHLTNGYTLEALREKTNVTLDVTVAQGVNTYYAVVSGLDIDAYYPLTILKDTYESGAADVDFNKANTQLMFKVNIPEDHDWRSSGYGAKVAVTIKCGSDTVYNSTVTVKSGLDSAGPGGTYQLALTPTNDAYLSDMASLEWMPLTITVVASDLVDANGTVGSVYYGSASSMIVGSLT